MENHQIKATISSNVAERFLNFLKKNKKKWNTLLLRKATISGNEAKCFLNFPHVKRSKKNPINKKSGHLKTHYNFFNPSVCPGDDCWSYQRLTAIRESRTKFRLPLPNRYQKPNYPSTHGQKHFKTVYFEL